MKFGIDSQLLYVNGIKSGRPNSSMNKKLIYVKPHYCYLKNLVETPALTQQQFSVLIRSDRN
jgi:hypothetical protein